MAANKKVELGILGLGVVGSGVIKAVTEKAEGLAQQVGCPLTIKRILVRHLSKQRAVQVAPTLLTTKAEDILDDPSIDMVVELIGGEHPALDYVKKALSQGKHVVTANKEIIAKHGAELLAMAQEQGVDLRYEASVGGGIPLIAPFQQDLIANKISAIHAIINGTTNYILTKMAREGMEFSLALKQAQELGYAEADPTKDVEGIDAAYKLAILASIAFRSPIRPEDVYREGITRLAARDFRYARELGYAIRLLAIAKEQDKSVEVRVHPTFVPEDLLLAKVEGAFNAVQVEGDLIGEVIFYGMGAGSLPTTSSVVADIVEVARNIHRGVRPRTAIHLDSSNKVKPMAEVETRYYLRMNVADSPGVLAQIAQILGVNQISISSVIQKETDTRARTAEIVIMTHPAREKAMRQALAEMEKLATVKEISNFVRVEA